MPLIAVLAYNLFISPLIFLAFHFYSIFNPKSRRGIAGRYQSIKKATDFRQNPENVGHDLFLIHCSSMGEFEHIKPFVRELKKRLPESRTVVMFFSPSGYENVKNAPGVDLFIYAPFDWWLPVMRLFKTLRPIALIIAKYDVWPNQMWLAERMDIPRFLINATLNDASNRLRFPGRLTLREVYRRFNRIFSISEADKRNYARLAPAEIIEVVGDTKYDQVIFRCEESRKKTVLPPAFHEGKRVFVAGSTWPADEAYLLPALKNLLKTHSDLLIVICPHEPTTEHLAQLEKQLRPLAAIRFSQMATGAQSPVLLIDKIGLLANLYAIADVAYVGGSFKQNVHNVLEPAVYGIPVMFGPVNQHSHEAQLLKQKGGGVEVYSAEDIHSLLEKCLSDETFRNETGKAARALVETHCGATRRTVDAVLQLLD